MKKKQMTNKHNLDELIKLFLEEANNEDLRRAKNRPKIQAAGAGIYILVVSFYWRTYNSGNQLLMI